MTVDPCPSPVSIQCLRAGAFFGRWPAAPTLTLSGAPALVCPSLVVEGMHAASFFGMLICMSGLHTDRGSPNLTLRLLIELKVMRVLISTWELRHRGYPCLCL